MLSNINFNMSTNNRPSKEKTFSFTGMQNKLSTKDITKKEDFEILEELSFYGYWKVVKAYNKKKERMVALKILEKEKIIDW